MADPDVSDVAARATSEKNTESRENGDKRQFTTDVGIQIWDEQSFTGNP